MEGGHCEVARVEDCEFLRVEREAVGMLVIPLRRVHVDEDGRFSFRVCLAFGSTAEERVYPSVADRGRDGSEAGAISARCWLCRGTAAEIAGYSSRCSSARSPVDPPPLGCCCMGRKKSTTSEVRASPWWATQGSTGGAACR